MTPEELALQKAKYHQYHVERQRNLEGKRQRGFYADGKPIISGKTKKQIKEGIKSGKLNSSGEPDSGRGLGPGYNSK